MPARDPPLKLTFLGTRGEIEARTRRHWRHSALLIAYHKARIMIDCGTDWLAWLHSISPTAIVLTHAHSDHAGGLANGAPCPVYATPETQRLLRRYPIRDPRKMPLRRMVRIGEIKFEACRVEHSIRAPAVGYRVSVSTRAFFYVPDVASIPSCSSVLSGISLYIGDGATLRRSMVRRTDGALIGHVPVATQLAWCAGAHVPAAIFTHCGSSIVRGDARAIAATVERLGGELGVNARIACDGEPLRLPATEEWERHTGC